MLRPSLFNSHKEYAEYPVEEGSEMEHQMKKGHYFLSLAFLAAVLLCGLSGNNASAERRNGNHPTCNGSIAECQEEFELLMDSDVHARLLAQGTIDIHKAVFNANSAACGKGNGQPYNGCSAKASNIYRRPCDKTNTCGARPGS